LTGINTVVFDLDGTLIEFRIDYQSIRQEAIEAIDQIKEIPMEIISSEISIFGMLNRISAYLDGRENAEAITENLRSRLSRIANKYEVSAAQTTKMIPGASQALKEIRVQGLKLGLFTTSGKEAMDHALRRFDLEKYFDACVPRDDAPKVKPDSSHLNLVLKILGTSPNQALVVGDTTLDITCAKAAGVRSIGVLTGVHKQNQLEAAGANYVINTLNELPPLVLKMGG